MGRDGTGRDGTGRDGTDGWMDEMAKYCVKCEFQMALEGVNTREKSYVRSVTGSWTQISKRSSTMLKIQNKRHFIS